MLITVLIPTYRRPKDLARCLEALQKQTRPADEVLVVVRDNDTETWTFLEAFNPAPLPLRTVKMHISGQVAALNAGLDTAQGDIIAITDDDTSPHVNWLEHIETNFLSDECIGGVGGRDWMYFNGQLQDTSMHPGASQVVGRLQWFGRVIGNNHLGVGEPREVDILKGANMSYRRAAITGLRFDERLRGAGAETHNDWAFSLGVKRRGWKLIYDPAVAVDHHLGQRFDEDQRTKQFNPIANINAAHNETLVLLDYLPPERCLIYLIWAVLVGARDNRGFLQLLRFLPSEGNLAVQKWLASMQGRWQGWRTWRQSTQQLRLGTPGNAVPVTK